MTAIGAIPLRGRERKRLGHLTHSQVERLLIAAELRKKAIEGERDE
ncbi:MAG TPA: hypothetical protein VM692_10070 [Gammaproteobacteria bacterium]|nr:hypothetical protein [Gammaproteobacteria bacterium]